MTILNGPYQEMPNRRELDFGRAFFLDQLADQKVATN